MILIVDNSEKLKKRYINDLRSLGVLAYGACEDLSFELLKQYTFDAILLINSLSFEDAADFCKRLKETAPKIPLIVLASEESEAELDKINLYADNIILPGTSLKKALPVIMEYVRIFSKRNRTDMIFGPVRIELYSQSVYIFGTRYDPTKTEYAILRYMVNAGCGVNIDELKKFCFLHSEETSNHSVIALISKLNLKTDKIFGRRIIERKDNGEYTIIS